MCVKLPPGELNPDPYPPHLTSIYTYKMITVPKMCGKIYIYIYIYWESLGQNLWSQCGSAIECVLMILLLSYHISLMNTHKQ